MVERRDVEFGVDSGDRPRGWLFLPSKPTGRLPAVSLAHGYAGVKEHGLERFARAFAEADFVVLVHDHWNFGASNGAVRHDIDPWRQIADWRRAISFLESLPEVDPNRIGVWGTSYAGGHVLVLGATDRRIRAVVSQVPTISGYEQGLRRVPPDAIAALERLFNEDERAQFRGEAPHRQQVVSDDLKTEQSERFVPLHPQLIAAGLLEYVNKQMNERGANAWLFPKVAPDTNGKAAFSKWFGRYIGAHGITDGTKVFHSFRHSFVDALRLAGVPGEINIALVGHTDPSVNGKYGAKDKAIRFRHRLAEAVASAAYAGLDLSHLTQEYQGAHAPPHR